MRLQGLSHGWKLELLVSWNTYPFIKVYIYERKDIKDFIITCIELPTYGFIARVFTYRHGLKSGITTLAHWKTPKQLHPSSHRCCACSLGRIRLHIACERKSLFLCILAEHPAQHNFAVWRMESRWHWYQHQYQPSHHVQDEPMHRWSLYAIFTNRTQQRPGLCLKLSTSQSLFLSTRIASDMMRIKVDGMESKSKEPFTPDYITEQISMVGQAFTRVQELMEVLEKHSNNMLM